MTKIKSYPRFDEIDNTVLRCWNRCAMAFNISEDKGEDACQKYLETFDKKSKKQMLIMFEYIKANGYENVKREVTRTTGSMEA